MFSDQFELRRHLPSSGGVRGGLRALVVGCCLALVVGCGASARKDFDLNRGEAVDDSAAAEVFGWDDWVTSADDSSATEWNYAVGEGDRLEITFFSHPEQNRHVIVRPDGRISMPFVGEIQAAGRSATVIGEELEEKYASVLIDPVVDVIVHETGARFYVIGEVRTPGEFAFNRPVSLLQAVARAGGYSGNARLNSFVLMRRLENGQSVAAVLNFREYMQLKDRRGDIALRPFDIVWVPTDAITRMDNVAKKAFSGILGAQEIVIQGWSLANFEEVFQRGTIRP
jgi:polysaccharide export outer membrane protein